MSTKSTRSVPTAAVLAQATVPSVSVLLPIRDEAQHLERAVASMLSQTLSDLEVIAVDDGSVDGTGEILARLQRSDRRLRLVRTARQGIVSALNRAAAAARAPLLARMDADDVSHPQRLEAQVQLLRQDDTLAGVSCLVETIGQVSPGWVRYMNWLNSCATPQQISRGLLIESCLAHPSMMLRATALTRAGGYHAFDGPEDYDLWLRLLDLGYRFDKVRRPLFRWRDRACRLTRTDRRYRPDAFARLKGQHLAVRLASLNRPVIIWGAGRGGRQLARALVGQGLPIAAFVDIDQRKIGRVVRGRPVLSLASLATRHEAYVLVAVPVATARPVIRGELRRQGRVEEQDFLICA